MRSRVLPVILCLIFILPISRVAFGEEASCEHSFASIHPTANSGKKYVATVVKTRDDKSKIYKIQTSEGQLLFFKENPNSNEEERLIFDDPEMSAIAFSASKSLGIGEHVASANLSPGVNLLVGGHTVHTRPGIMQAGFDHLITPIDEFMTAHPGVQPTAKDIQEILNTGEWPRLYADWKIFWRIFQQTDLSIANLARDGDALRIFDVGDLLNFNSVRSRMGIRSDLDNIHFNMPNASAQRVEHRADFRKADPAFRDLAKTIATESDEATAERLGKQLNDVFAPPRGSVRDHVREMKEQARRIVELLDKNPFDY